MYNPKVRKIICINPEDRIIKIGRHMLTAVAYIPPDEIEIHFDLLRDGVPEDLLVIANYFEATYVCGRSAMGRRRAVVPPQHDAVLENIVKTNNLSEGWHNRLQVVMGRKHPSLYTFLKELPKEEAHTKTVLRQLKLGQKVKKRMNNK